MFSLQPLAVGVLGHFDRRSDHQNRTAKRFRDLEQVPGFFKRPRTFESDVEHDDGAASATSQHDGAGFGDVARPAGPINCECGIKAFLKPLCHHRQAAKSPSCRAALRRAIAQPLDHAPRPLSVEIRCVHQHGVAVPEIPGSRDDATMPEGIDVWRLVRPVVASSTLSPQDFKSKRWPEDANYGPDYPTDDGNLDSLPELEFRQACIVVNRHARFFYF